MDKDSDKCPLCGADLTGGPIPEESLRAGHYGKWDGITPQYYSRMIGCEISGTYDGVLYWSCPDCGGAWHRWRNEHMRDKAQRYIDEQNEKAGATAPAFSLPFSRLTQPDYMTTSNP